MDQIQHSHIEVRGLKLHIAEIGNGSKVVILLHGFPEIWYTWRHQMLALANAGYRAIATDFRGYGLSDTPANPQATSFKDLVLDLLGIVDHLDISKAFLIAKDFGIRPAYVFALQHPDRVAGVITLGVPYSPPDPSTFHRQLPEGFYISRWQEVGKAEADFGRFDAKTVVRKIYTMFSRNELPIAEENQEIMDLVGPETPLPYWFSEEDLEIYGSLYQKSGFQTALQVPYRSLNETYDIPDPVIKLPMLTIMGGEDYSLKFPGMQEYIKSGKVKEFAPESEITFLPEGTHFTHEQLPEMVNNLILSFLGKANKEKTTFISPCGVFNYGMMHGLKNVASTYQRFRDQILKGQGWRYLEVYTDNSIVKSKEKTYIIIYLRKLERRSTLRGCTT